MGNNCHSAIFSIFIREGLVADDIDVWLVADLCNYKADLASNARNAVITFFLCKVVVLKNQVQPITLKIHFSIFCF